MPGKIILKITISYLLKSPLMGDEKVEFR